MRQLALYGMTVEKAFTPQLSLKETFLHVFGFQFSEMCKSMLLFYLHFLFMDTNPGWGGGWDDYCSCCLQQHKEDVN